MFENNGFKNILDGYWNKLYKHGTEENCQR